MQDIKTKKQQILKTDAFYNTSFDPEKRIKHFADSFEREEIKIIDLCTNYGVDAERFLDKHFRLTMDYLGSEKRCASAAVVGFSKFPVEKMEKRRDSAMNKLSRLSYFLENIEKTLIKITRPKETQNDKKEKWLKQLEEAKIWQEVMKEVNADLRKGLTPEEAYGMRGLPCKKNCWGNYGFESYELRNNLANIKRLENQIAQIDRLQQKEISDFHFDGGHVEYDPEEIRFNIFFEGKPEEDIRTKLKSRGFKWSPRRGAWTRGAKTISLKTIKELLEGIKYVPTE